MNRRNKNIPEDQQLLYRCQRLMKWRKINAVIRIAAIMIIGYFNIFYLGIESAKTGSSLILGAVILYAVIIVMAFLTLTNRKIFVWSTIALLLTGILTRLILSLIGVFPVILFLWQLHEITQHEWLRQQEGYPQFHPRLTQVEKETAKSEELFFAAIAKPTSDTMEEIDTQDILLPTANAGQAPEMPDVENFFIPKSVPPQTSIPAADGDHLI